MKKQLLFYIITILLIISCVQQPKNSKNEELYLHVDTTGPEVYSYISKRGETIIPPNKYFRAYTDTIKTIGFVSKKGGPLIAINKNDEELFKVYPFDNGPDYVKEGLFRMVGENGLIGFADLDGTIVIPPRFENISSFSDGLAAFCENCLYQKVSDNPKIRGIKINGAWGFVNKKGDVEIEPQFDRVDFFIEGRCKVSKNSRTYYIDKTGNEVK